MTTIPSLQNWSGLVVVWSECSSKVWHEKLEGCPRSRGSIPPREVRKVSAGIILYVACGVAESKCSQVFQLRISRNLRALFLDDFFLKVIDNTTFENHIHLAIAQAMG